MKKLSTDQVNYLNIALILLATVAAYLIPFQLFLFSYAVLGPLHYASEISWLHDRNCFTKVKADGLLTIGFSIIVVALLMTNAGKPELATSVIFIAFVGGLLLLYVRPFAEVNGALPLQVGQDAAQ